jgi:hypothetical protein
MIAAKPEPRWRLIARRALFHPKRQHRSFAAWARGDCHCWCPAVPVGAFLLRAEQGSDLRGEGHGGDRDRRWGRFGRYGVRWEAIGGIFRGFFAGLAVGHYANILAPLALCCQ